METQKLSEKNKDFFEQVFQVARLIPEGSLVLCKNFTVRSITLLCFFTHIYSNSHSQNFIVLDSLTYKSIPSVSIIASNVILYTNDKGEIPKSEINLNEFEVRFIGYENKTVKNYSGDTIFLSPKIYDLNEITIKSKYKNYELGYHQKWQLFPHSFSGKEGITIAVFIPNDGKTSIIESIIISFNEVVSLNTYKVHLYDVSSIGYPNKKIYSRLIEHKQSNKKRIIEVSETNMIIPSQGIFVAFEWIEQNSLKQNNFPQPKVNLTRKVDNNLTFIKNISNWVRFDGAGDIILNCRFGLKMRM